MVEIAAHETQFNNVFAESEKLMAASTEEEEVALKEKMQNLRHRRDRLNNATSQRQTNLIEALVLAQQFADTAKEVKSRLSGRKRYCQHVKGALFLFRNPVEIFTNCAL